MQSGMRWRKRLLRWAEVGVVVIGLSVFSTKTWAGSADQPVQDTGGDQQDGESCIETVQEWIEDGETHFIDWNGHGKCRPDSKRVKAPAPETVVSKTMKDVEALLLSVLGLDDERN